MKKILCIALLAVSALAGCIKDNSTESRNQISKITLVGTMEQEYQVDAPNTLEITAPEVKQSVKDKPLSYEWQIDYKVVGTERILKFPASKLGKVDARLKISNEDGEIYVKFKVQVNARYEQGLAIVAERSGKMELGFKRIDNPAIPIVSDAYGEANPTVPLGSAIDATQFRGKVYILSSNRNVAVDYKTFKIIDDMGYAANGAAARIFASNIYDEAIIINKNGTPVSYDYTTDYALPKIADYLGTTISPLSAWLYSDASSTYTNGLLFWNYVNHRMMLSFGNGYYYTIGLTSTEEYTNADATDPAAKRFKITDHDCIWIGTGQNYAMGLLAMKNRTTNKFSVMTYVQTVQNPAWYPNNREIYPKGKIINYTDANFINANSVFANRMLVTVLYYTDGTNKVYKMNYLNGKFDDKEAFTVGNPGDKIVSMILSSDDKQLCIAVNSATGENRGSIYCYDCETDKLVWSEVNKTAEIIRIFYKSPFTN